MTKEEILERALNKSCLAYAHLMYYHEDEQDEDNPHTNVASVLYRIDAKNLKERFIKEAEKDPFPYL